MIKPFCLQIESTNACNLNCIMCPRQAMTREIGYMDFALFKKIIDEAAPLDHVWLHHFGEPLLHPKLLDMIKYAKNKEIRMVGISTNAVALTTEKGKELIESELDFLIISMDGTHESYEQIRKGANWNDVFQNIKAFLEMKKSKKPETWIQIIDMPHVDIDKTVKIWQTIQYIDRIDVKKFDTWAHQVDAINQIKTKQLIYPRKPCPHVWAGMVICWDGKCVPCCRDYNAKIVLGDVNKQNVIDIFNSDKYNQLREQHMKNNFNNPLCRNCMEWAESLNRKTMFVEKVRKSDR